MAFSDLQTVLGVAQNVFGQGVIPNFAAGVILLLAFIFLGFTLQVGFEALAIFTVLLSYALIQGGLLPAWLMGVWMLGAALAFTIVLTMLIRRT